MRVEMLLMFAAMLLNGTAIAAGNPSAPQWTWEAGKQTNNGAITIKSTNGSTTYTGTQNPTGAAAKVNQNAATQPPTIVMPAAGNNRWSLYYKDRAQGLP